MPKPKICNSAFTTKKGNKEPWNMITRHFLLTLTGQKIILRWPCVVDRMLKIQLLPSLLLDPPPPPHTHTHIHAQTSTHTQSHTHMHKHTHTQPHTHTHKHAHTHTHSCPPPPPTPTHLCTSTKKFSDSELSELSTVCDVAVRMSPVRYCHWTLVYRSAAERLRVEYHFPQTELLLWLYRLCSNTRSSLHSTAAL